MKLRAAAAAALVLLAACGGGGGGDGDDDVATLAEETGAEETTSTTVDPEEAMLAFASCMRDEGVAFPDPGPDGEIEIRVEESDEAAWRAAEGVCGHLRPEMAPMSEDEQAEVSDALLAQAACMRDLGWDMPDPEITTPADGGVQFRFPRKLDIDPDDPEFQADSETCHEESGLDDGALMGGGSGGFGG
ncbi:MAG TPA: hypothetical protein VEA78_09700 [Acidimicrobiales bacterium]|nr:hypothetical protein [Acidimicrobiales bacterium]